MSCHCVQFWQQWHVLFHHSTWPGIAGALQWRHNDPDGVANHRRLCCPFVQADQTKHQFLCHWPLWGKFTWWAVDSLHKGPVITRKMFLFDDVIMSPQLIWTTIAKDNLIMYTVFIATSPISQWVIGQLRIQGISNRDIKQIIWKDSSPAW